MKVTQRRTGHKLDKQDIKLQEMKRAEQIQWKGFSIAP
jgi:hypothetical protein